MGISNRDGKKINSSLRRQSGQGLVEYVLILVVTIGLVLGLMHKLNTAFKKWAENYFGNYIACLLETGELPSVGGGAGANSDSCESQFEPFSLANGRPGKVVEGTGDGGSSSGSASGATGGGAQEYQRHGAGGAAGNYQQIKGFSGRGGSRSGMTTRNALKGFEEKKNTGDMSTQKYGTNYGALNRKLKTGVKHRLDNGFAFKQEQEEKQTRKTASVGKKKDSNNGRKARLALNNKVFKKSNLDDGSDSISFGDYIKYLILAAILIALLMFLGGQAVQINKSME